MSTGTNHPQGHYVTAAHLRNLANLLVLSMASSDVDQKWLGRFAKSLAYENPALSTWLYRILGLSIGLSQKLIHARQARKLDPTRDTPSLALYHHIIWLSREGLSMLEANVLPLIRPDRVGEYPELVTLVYKLRASFYHIYVLFHNNPTPFQAALPKPREARIGESPSQRKQKNPRGDPPGPPGLSPIPQNRAVGNFLLPAMDYIPAATRAFREVAKLATDHLPGSHPLRLSVMLEFSAFIYDCLKEANESRRLAKQSIGEVYNAQEGMDDEQFEDAAELVSVLGRMMRRGQGASPKTAKTGSAGSGGTTKKSSPGSRSGNGGSAGSKKAVPSPGMVNPI